VITVAKQNLTFARSGHSALRLVTDEARRVAEMSGGPNKRRLLQMCDEIDRLGDSLADMQRRGMVGWRVEYFVCKHVLGSHICNMSKPLSVFSYELSCRNMTSMLSSYVILYFIGDPP
jgi:hypothetical protein